MQRIKLLALAIFTAFSFIVQAQNAEEIIAGYLENIGGTEALSQLKGVKMTAKVNQGGMEIPVEMVQMTSGKTYSKVSFQGMEIMQGVFDGDVLWSTNFQSMKAEKSDDETTANMKLDANDFPDPFLNYEEKGYTVELVGTETMEGTETFKIKLTKEPKTIDGQEVEDIAYYFFDTEAFVPLAMETEVKQGPQKGMVQLITMSDYQEVDGIYFPFSLTQGAKGSPGFPISIEELVTNPDIEDSAFAFPEEVAEEKGN